MPMSQGTTTDDYRNAPSGEGPLATEWADKPHRLVYDLCGEVEALQADVRKLRDVAQAAQQLRKMTSRHGYGLSAPEAEALDASLAKLGCR
jgi:hypothetical protein